jgi:DNA-binding response OmpR family regulator
MRVWIAGECAGLAALLRDAGHVIVDREPFDLAIVTRSHEPPLALKIVRGLRARDPALPILMLTRDGSVEERVDALESGADDALATPFTGSQMVARVGALGRRGALAVRAPSILEIDGCFIDLDRAKAARGEEEPVSLTKRELELVRYLHRHRARAVTREELLEHVFEISPRAETRSVDMAIAVLRKKLERDPKSPNLILSVKSVGYRWGEE